MQQHLKKLILLATGDLILINLSFILSIILKFESLSLITNYFGSLPTVFLLSVIHLGTFILFGIYKQLWPYAGLKEVLILLLSVFTSVLNFFIYDWFFLADAGIGITFYAILYLVLTIGTLGYRLAPRIYSRILRKLHFYHIRHMMPEEEFKPIRTMLIGAGDAASLVIQDLRSSEKSKRQIVVAVDDNIKKIGSSLGGVPIKGTVVDIPKLVNEYDITELLITMPSVSKSRISEILEICKATSCKLKIFRGIDQSIDSKSGLGKVRNVKIEDLLGRDEIKLNNNSLTSFIKGKTILVTGGGGSIGSELCRQIASFDPETLIILDIYENNAYDLQNELIQSGIDRNKLQVLIGSVRDRKKLRDIFKKYHPHMVFHAAAHKHVPLMEDCPEEAIKNNVFGTLNTARLAKEYNVDKFILISTDKAVNPTNVMGATKRLCEMIVQSIGATSTHTEFVAVRFGNVLGSNGSVIPLFKRQLDAGGPLTVTHPEIIRYFMTIPEAVRLILQATTFATGGEIFVLDMGKPVKILDLAKNFIRLSGYKEGEDIEITFTGLRPGEKLYEELLMSEEGLTKTASDKIFVAKPLHTDFDSLMAQLHILEKSLANKDVAKKALADIVDTYTIDRAHLEDPSILDDENPMPLQTYIEPGVTA